MMMLSNMLVLGLGVAEVSRHDSGTGVGEREADAEYDFVGMFTANTMSSIMEVS